MSQEYKLRCKRHRTILVGPKLSGILDILTNTQEQVRYNQLRMKSKIKLKESYIKYLKFCTDKKLVSHWTLPGKRIAGCRQSWFVITEEGRYFLRMLS